MSTDALKYVKNIRVFAPAYGPELKVLGYMQEEDGGTCPYFYKVGGLVVCPAKRYGCDWDTPGYYFSVCILDAGIEWIRRPYRSHEYMAKLADWIVYNYPSLEGIKSYDDFKAWAEELSRLKLKVLWAIQSGKVTIDQADRYLKIGREYGGGMRGVTKQ